MADSYTVLHLDEVGDLLGKYPGDMKMLKHPLRTDQVALTYRRMPQHTGGKGSYGHRHRIQEEVIFVISGHLQIKIDDDIVEVGPKTAVRIAPGATQSVWNDRPEEVELLIISTKLDPEEHVEKVENFWPEDTDAR